MLNHLCVSVFLIRHKAAVSQHIKTLKEANLVIAYKEGYYVMYELNNMRHRQLSFDEITKIYIERINGK